MRSQAKLGTRLRGTGAAAVLAALACLQPGFAHAAAPGVPAGWCGVRNTRGAVAATGSEPTGPVYVATACVPSPVWLEPYGGALAGLLSLTYDSPADAGVVVGARGALYQLWGKVGAAGGFAPSEVRAVAPSGRALWHHAVPVDASAPVGDARVVAVAEGARALIVDERTRRAAVVALPTPPRPTSGLARLDATCAVVGGLVVATASWVPVRAGERDASAGVVSLYTATGRLLRHWTVPGAPAKAAANVPWLGFAIAMEGTRAYVVYSDEPAGTTAGLYVVSAGGSVAGPYAVPAPATAALGGSVVPLPGDRLLLDAGGPTATSKDSHGALLALFGRRPQVVWSRPIPGADPVWDGANLLTTGPQAAGVEPGIATVWVVSVAGGQMITAFSPNADPGLKVLAAGPGGVLELTVPRAFDFGPPPCGGVCPPALPDQLVLERLDGSVAWSVPLADGADLTSAVLDMAGRPAVFVGGSGLAVAWGGQNQGTSAPAGVRGYATAAVEAAPVRPPATGVAGYAVVDQGRVVTPQSPLVVSAVQAGHAIDLTLSAVSAGGRPMASPSAVRVRVSDPSGTGSIDDEPGAATLTIPAGAASVPLAFVPAKAGSYALAAVPVPTALPAPVVPAVIPVPGNVQVEIPYYDPNGVPYPLPSGQTLDVVTNGTEVQTPLHAASAGAGGVWTAVVPTNAVAIGTYWAFATQIWTPEGSVGSPSAPVQALVTSGAAPTLTATAGPSGVGLTVSGPIHAAAVPIAYAIYRVRGRTDALPAGALPVAVIDPAARRALAAAYVDPAGAGTYTYFAAALYADQSAGPPGAGTTVAVR